jgi:hypothetical protein
MKRGRTIVVLFTVLAVLVLGYFIFFASGKKHYQWYESYNPESNQPYGTLFLRKLLETYRPNGKFIFNRKKTVLELLDSTQYLTGTDYVLIGPTAFLDHHDVEAMAKFIQRGNDAFIASHEPPYELINKIYENYCEVSLEYLSNPMDEVELNFYHDTLKSVPGYRYRYRFASMDRSYQWDYLTEEIFCDSTDAIVPLGFQNGNLVNFFRIPYGKGNLYLHSNPLVFTNYFLIHSDKAEYASGVFLHLQGKNLIWDEFSKLPYSQNHNEYNSPLYFMLQQPSLKYAWWMVLVTVVIFIFFAANRKQRIIPVIEPKTNTSLEFVTMISALHYQNANHLDIARKKMKYFLYFIRMRYGIHTHSFTQAQVPILAERSKVNETFIQQVFDRWNVIENFGYSSIEEQRLVDLYNAIDTFYKQCK